MPEGETKCLSPGTPRVSRGCGDHRLERLPDAGTRRCHQTQPSTHQMSRCDRVITADYLGSKGSNIIEEDITLRWGMNI